jgi:RNA polymerase sigma factor, sigma-70 family
LKAREIEIEELNIREILNSAADGNTVSFDLLVKKYNKNMVTIASIYVNQEAEDVVQTVWTRIFEKKEVLKRVENIDNWLFYVVKNQCMDYLRKHKRQQRISDISIEANQEYIDSLLQSDDIFEIILKNQSRVVIYQHIMSLGEIYYMPIILHYFKNLSLNEISEILNVSVSTLKGRLYTARQLLKKLIPKYYYN